MDASRSQILNALRNSRTGIPFSESQDLPKIPEPEWNLEEKVERLKNRMEAVHTEIHECTEKGFGKIFREVIKQKKITNLLYGKKTNWGNKLEAMRQRGPKTMPELIPYQKKIEDCKETLFSVDAGLTQTIGAIAETGSLILKPDEQEPR
ncbi:MAG: LUD domain-containing protein, partial [SAR324 cluster bacterium]|nr:LUD domain-containing protein [SAR324 cluster bacterium]